ncbi:uncharacterized protein AMSG_11775 [Thecamonas trahens ATCC 50062]|uniref:Uncharacterized protein n=1 Tax=Thecamonas trahens ATCC 50062 TaxID=461836 RepID=A0A0L0D493_THETB|nr:hypothetical protein AMSG_11775 [Thecamonas trahens ATCC 50062]KNC47182.1 hypothetical protein AMSG_11775 [Thecamonas trahens ATCC 50062]|eukprot:XP_013760008.1 hypothetical protein AMSG_11775 [Thecamonas trahens ATCC 50062]
MPDPLSRECSGSGSGSPRTGGNGSAGSGGRAAPRSPVPDAGVADADGRGVGQVDAEDGDLSVDEYPLHVHAYHNNVRALTDGLVAALADAAGSAGIDDGMLDDARAGLAELAGPQEPVRATLAARALLRKDARGRTPLMWAAIGNAPDAMAVLLRSVPVYPVPVPGGSPEYAPGLWSSSSGGIGDVWTAADDNGYTTLHWAAIRGVDDVLPLLVPSPEPAEPQPAVFAGPRLDVLLEDSVAFGHVEDRGTFAHFLAREDLAPALAHVLGVAAARPPPDHLLTNILATRDVVGRTPLGTAAAYGATAAIEVILDHAGALELDEPDAVGRTPLMWAGAGGHVAAFTALVRAGALLSHPDAQGNTPLHYIAMQGAVACINAVSAALAPEADARHGTSLPPHIVNVTDSKDRTPLFWAVNGKQLGAVTALLDAGADVSAVDSRGRTALHWAAYAQYGAVTKALLTAGADPGVSDALGRTPLFHAAHVGDAVFLRTCIRFVAVPTKIALVADGSGRQALHMAAAAGHVNALRILHRLGAVPLDAPDVHGVTPLHLAAYTGTIAALRYLVQAGALVDVRDASGRTPLHWAAASGSIPAVYVLLSLGAPRDAPDTSGALPCHYASAISADDVSAALEVPGWPMPAHLPVLPAQLVVELRRDPAVPRERVDPPPAAMARPDVATSPIASASPSGGRKLVSRTSLPLLSVPSPPGAPAAGRAHGIRSHMPRNFSFATSLSSTSPDTASAVSSPEHALPPARYRGSQIVTKVAGPPGWPIHRVSVGVHAAPTTRSVGIQHDGDLLAHPPPIRRICSTTTRPVGPSPPRKQRRRRSTSPRKRIHIAVYDPRLEAHRSDAVPASSHLPAQPSAPTRHPWPQVSSHKARRSLRSRAPSHSRYKRPSPRSDAVLGLPSNPSRTRPASTTVSFADQPRHRTHRRRRSDHLWR